MLSQIELEDRDEEVSLGISWGTVDKLGVFARGRGRSAHVNPASAKFPRPDISPAPHSRPHGPALLHTALDRVAAGHFPEFLPRGRASAASPDEARTFACCPGPFLALPHFPALVPHRAQIKGAALTRPALTTMHQTAAGASAYDLAATTNSDRKGIIGTSELRRDCAWRIIKVSVALFRRFKRSEAKLSSNDVDPVTNYIGTYHTTGRIELRLVRFV
ncbi:hypothetical protein FA95DRAFT_1556225 [Auriscalpium vulgare]|uniref:Uncharacterized protein n=1 Tax=Auriscalpium vulgare TaxID=40419 RepID=A0ACB8S1B4_9AGAM|nr:hypothetical protein FA95DRAFT_1556225 [Auriscalpium vulgare]